MNARKANPLHAPAIPERKLARWLSRGWVIRNFDTALNPNCLELTRKGLRVVWVIGGWRVEALRGGEWRGASVGTCLFRGVFWSSVESAVWACEHDEAAI